MGLTAVLIDTVSNQEYIFSGNRLKENLGGSHLLKTVYRAPLQKALDGVAPGNSGLEAWETGGNAVQLAGGAEIGYIGGGNALIFFDTPVRAKKFIGVFSRILLTTRPGLKTAFGVLESFGIENATFTESMGELHKKLQEAKNAASAITLPPRQGVTAACPNTGEAIEIGRIDPTKETLVSALSYSRLTAADKSTQELQRTFEAAAKPYVFTDQAGKLGQKDSKSYVAVVHADGNSMGGRFRNCADLGSLRKLSVAVSLATMGAFGLLVADAAGVVKEHLAKDDGFDFQKNLPLRPIIIGGDDVTFVCEGRLGLYFAERFLKHIETESEKKESPFTACAGVAIVKSKYPFYKAYEYAEGLCTEAKRESRNNNDGAYLDFLVSSSGFSGSMEHIRKRNFVRAADVALHYGPYRCSHAPSQDKTTTMLREGIKRFQDKEQWSHAQAMRLRELLTGKPDQCKNFVTANGLELPVIPQGGDSVTLLNAATPFYDMLDAMDFYPSALLGEVEK